MTTYYAYDKETGLYTGIVYPQKNPRNKDKLLIPANATTKPPLEGKENSAVIFDKNEWKYIDDYRGEIVSDTDEFGRVQTVVIRDLGVKPEDIKISPLPPLDYKEQRARLYPSITDQLDEIMKWLATEKEITIPAGLKSMAMRCMNVKSRVPKTEKEDATK